MVWIVVSPSPEKLNQKERYNCIMFQKEKEGGRKVNGAALILRF
jgi:hypothetical protein